MTEADWDRLCDRRDEYRDDPPREEEEPESSLCAGCETEVGAGEEIVVGVRGFCRSCAAVEAMQILARHLCRDYTPTRGEVRESERLLIVMEELLQDVDDAIRNERKRFSPVEVKS